MFLSRLVRRKKTTAPSLSEQITTSDTKSEDFQKRDSNLFEISGKKTTVCEYCYDDDNEQSSKSIKTTVEAQSQEGADVTNETSEDKSATHEAEHSKETTSKLNSEDFHKRDSHLFEIPEKKTTVCEYCYDDDNEQSSGAVKTTMEAQSQESADVTSETSEHKSITHGAQHSKEIKSEGEKFSTISREETEQITKVTGVQSETQDEAPKETLEQQQSTEGGEVSKRTDKFEGDTLTTVEADKSVAMFSFAEEGQSTKESEFEGEMSTVQHTETGVGEKPITMSPPGKKEQSTEEGEVTKETSKLEGGTSTIQPTENGEGENSVATHSSVEEELSTKEGEVPIKPSESGTVQSTETEQSVAMSSSAEEEQSTEEGEASEETSEFERKTSTNRHTETGQGEKSSPSEEQSTEEGGISKQTTEFEGTTVRHTETGEGEKSVATSPSGKEEKSTKKGEVSEGTTSEFEGESSTIHHTETDEGEEPSTEEGEVSKKTTSEFEGETSNIQHTDKDEESVTMSPSGKKEQSTKKAEVSEETTGEFEGETSKIQQTDEAEQSVAMSSSSEEQSRKEGEVSEETTAEFKSETSAIHYTETIEAEESVATKEKVSKETPSEFEGETSIVHHTETEKSVSVSSFTKEITESEEKTSIGETEEAETSGKSATSSKESDELTHKGEEATKSTTSSKQVKTTEANGETSEYEKKETTSSDVIEKSQSTSSSSYKEKESDITKEFSEAGRHSSTSKAKEKTEEDENKTIEPGSETKEPKEDETTKLNIETTPIEEATIEETKAFSEMEETSTIGKNEEHEFTKESSEAESTITRIEGEIGKTTKSDQSTKSTKLEDQSFTGHKATTRESDEIESTEHATIESEEKKEGTESTITEKSFETTGEAEETEKVTGETSKEAKTGDEETSETSEAGDDQTITINIEELKTLDAITEFRNESKGEKSTQEEERNVPADVSTVPVETEESNEKTKAITISQKTTKKTQKAEESEKTTTETEEPEGNAIDLYKTTVGEEEKASTQIKEPKSNTIDLHTISTGLKTEMSTDEEEELEGNAIDLYRTTTEGKYIEESTKFEHTSESFTEISEDKELSKALVTIDEALSPSKHTISVETESKAIETTKKQTEIATEVTSSKTTVEIAKNALEFETTLCAYCGTTLKKTGTFPSTEIKHTLKESETSEISPSRPGISLATEKATKTETFASEATEIEHTSLETGTSSEISPSKSGTRKPTKTETFPSEATEIEHTSLETETSELSPSKPGISFETEKPTKTESFPSEATEIEHTSEEFETPEMSPSKAHISHTTEMETKVTSSETTLEIAKNALEFETSSCKYCGTTSIESALSKATEKQHTPKTTTEKSTVTKISTRKILTSDYDEDQTETTMKTSPNFKTTIGMFQKNMVIIVNNNRNFNKEMLESYMNVTLPDVQMLYVDLNQEKEEPKKPWHYRGQKIIETEKCTSDSTKGTYCICDVSSYLKNLLNRVNNGKWIKSQRDYCEKYLKIDTGLIIKPLSVKEVGRKKRGLIYMENQKKKAKKLVFDSIENLFADEFNLTLTGESMFCLQGETILIPCKIHINEDTEVVWKFHSLSSNEDVHLPEKVPKLLIHGAAIKHAGNYTCSAAPNGQNTTTIDHWRELEIITFPVYNIHMTIYYKINSSCSLQTGDVIHTYLPKIISPLVCPKDYNDICGMEMERPRCISREDDNYFNVTMDIKMNLDFLLQLEAMCNINCKLRIYENLVHIVYSTLETIQHVPVYYHLEDSDTIIFVPHTSGKEDSAVRIVPPKIIVTCPDGFGLESKKRSVCVVCPPQTFSDESNAFCKSCPLGHYQPDPGSKVCLQCSSPVDDKLCLRMLYTDTKLFKIYVGVAFSFIVLMVILTVAWTSGLHNNNDRGQSYEGSLRHRAAAKTPRDLETGVMEPLLARQNSPPPLPEIDF